MIRALLFLILSFSAAHAVPWHELSEREQELLLPFAADWEQLAAESQERLRAGAVLWAAMPPEERHLARQRFHEWQEMPSEQRQRIRERYSRFRALPAEQQRILKQVYQHFHALPPEQRARLRARFDSMSPAEKRAFLQGMRVAQSGQHGSDVSPLRGMPAGQQRWFRVVSLSLSQPARARLMGMLRNGKQNHWDRLQQALEPMSIAQREEFLLSTQID